MTVDKKLLLQKQVLSELLDLSMNKGFGVFYSLNQIAKKVNTDEVLYDNNTNTGILWDFGTYGNGMIQAYGDWPEAVASINYYDSYRRVEKFIRNN